MTLELQPCASCARHVKVGTRVCPFCGAGGTAKRHIPKNTTARMALTAAAAASALGACSSATSGEIAYGSPCAGDGSCEVLPEDSGSHSDAEGGTDGHAIDGGPDGPRD
jgi:hypothetical protein